MILCDIHFIGCEVHIEQDINIFTRNHVAVHNDFAVSLLHRHINANIANQLLYEIVIRVLITR